MKKRTIKIPKDMLQGSIHPTKYNGDIEVVEYLNAKKVKVRFLNTKHEKYTTASYIRTGVVGDPYSPRVYGQGYMGEGSFPSLHTEHKTSNKCYDTWHSMLRRCYCPIALIQDPQYAGCTVSEVWKCYQKFAEWYYTECATLKVDPERNGLHLDKDVLHTQGGKQYSPNHCKLVLPQENAEEANAKHWVLKSPTGEEVKVFNLSKFAKEQGLIASSLYALLNSTSPNRQHRGWKRA